MSPHCKEHENKKVDRKSVEFVCFVLNIVGTVCVGVITVGFVGMVLHNVPAIWRGLQSTNLMETALMDLRCLALTLCRVMRTFLTPKQLRAQNQTQPHDNVYIHTFMLFSDIVNILYHHNI